MIESLKRLGTMVLDTVYPRVCPVCRDIVTPKGELVCPDCREKLPYITEPLCMRCGRPLASDQEEYCNDCGKQEFSYERGFAVFAYDDIMQRAVADFKYHNKKELAEFFASEMYSLFCKKLRGLGIEALVPVPVHAARRRYRGYNQAQVMCRALSERTGVPLAELLVRNRKTMPQKELTRTDRLRNLECAIGMKPEHDQKILPRTVLLIDDIYTTGSTAEACSRVLLRGGVGKVYICTLCIATEW